MTRTRTVVIAVMLTLPQLAAASRDASQQPPTPPASQPQPPAAASPPVVSPASLGMFVYPAKSQPGELQKKDEAECYGWAREESGIDPLAPAKPAEAPPPSKGAGGAAVKGAAKGAVVGTAIGAIAGDTGEGAAIGAVAGGLRGRRQAKGQKKAQQEAQQQAQAQQVQTVDTFKKAFGVCLEGRGYSVK